MEKIKEFYHSMFTCTSSYYIAFTRYVIVMLRNIYMLQWYSCTILHNGGFSPQWRSSHWHHWMREFLEISWPHDDEFLISWCTIPNSVLWAELVLDLLTQWIHASQPPHSTFWLWHAIFLLAATFCFISGTPLQELIIIVLKVYLKLNFSVRLWIPRSEEIYYVLMELIFLFA